MPGGPSFPLLIGTTSATEPCRAHGDARWRRPLVALLLLSGAGLVGTGALASWDVTANVDSGALDTTSAGAVSLDSTNSTAFSTGVANLVPGDYFNRYVDLTNTGDSGPVTGTVSSPGALAGGLSVKVDACPVAWTAATCSGTVVPRLAATPLTGPVTVNHGTMARGAVEHLRYGFTFDANAPASLQNKTGSVSITVSNVVRTGKDRTSS